MDSGKRMWMVRAGEGGYIFDDFKGKSLVAIGWGNLGDLSEVNSPEKIKELTKSAYPESKLGTVYNVAGQMNRFRFGFKKGDQVVTYDPQSRVYMIGEIISDYTYDKTRPDYKHTRKVKWLGEVPRDKISTSTKNTLGAISAIFEIGDDAQRELNALLSGKKVEAAASETKEELDVIKDDTIEKSREFIKDRVLALSWEEMQELVAGLLRSMSYKTIVSPKGSDLGRDIQASPDGLGLEEPRIKVEVKHRSGQMGSKEIRSFMAVLREGDRGLYISTGGFSKDATYEAERSKEPMKLIDLDMLVTLITQYYDNFDTDARDLIPLTKIYWPI